MYRYRKTIKEPFLTYSCAPTNLSDDEVQSRKSAITNRLGYITIASIDPAVKNFAVRIEQRFTWKAAEYSASDEPVILPILFDKTNVGEGYAHLTDLLETITPSLMTCDYILVERQMPDNYQMVRVSQHCISYCITALRKSEHYPLIIEIDPKLKGKMLGAPPVTYHELKKWGVRKALEICQERNDKASYDKLVATKKADDLADSLLQIEAWCQWLHQNFN